MFKPEPISRTGYNNLKKELEQIQTEELPEVRKRVALAREDGDLKENGAYIYGRQQQGILVGKIAELKGKLSRSDIIDCTKVDCDRAVFGTVVTLLDLDTQQKVTYQLLGADEADLDNGSISIKSPIGRSIAGHSIGDKITVSVPRGDRNLEIIDIAKPELD